MVGHWAVPARVLLTLITYFASEFVRLRFSLLYHIVLGTLSLSPCPHVLPADSLSSPLGLTLCGAPQVVLHTYLKARNPGLVHPNSAPRT